VSRRCLLSSVAALTLLCGCGGHGQAQPAVLRRGRSVFASACASCHTLTGRDTRARGGDLAIATLSARDIAGFVRIMPVHLSRADVEAVSRYVHAAAAGASTRH